MNTTPWLRGSLLLLPLLAARAGAPMATEDAGVLAAGECEWETVAERVRAGAATGRGAETGVACQLFKGSQAGLKAGRASADGTTLSSLALTGKTALSDAEDRSLSLAWSVDAHKLPGGSLRRDGSALALVVSQLLGALSLHANLGWSRSHLSDETTGFWAFGAEWALNDDFQLLAEQYGAQRSKPVWGLGARWQASPAWSLGLMHSRSREQPASRAWLLSAKLGF